MSPAGGSERQPWLLVSDIDDTLTGDDDALAELAKQLAKRRSSIKVAVNSSRPSASVDATLSSVFPSDFPVDAIITAMGTEIRIDGKPLTSWTRRFDGWPADRIRISISDLGYQPHPDEFQTAAKVSFAVPKGADQDRVIAALRAENLPFQAIGSGTDDLDILPPGAGKGAAARHLAGSLGISIDHIVAAGDSGNDVALFEAAALAIAVGNARAELLQAMPAERSYHAAKPFAAGVLEGLQHFRILDVKA